MNTAEGQVSRSLASPALAMGAPAAEPRTLERFRWTRQWLKQVAPYAVLGLLVPGGAVAALLMWSARHGGGLGVALARTVRIAALFIVALALPSRL